MRAKKRYVHIAIWLAAAFVGFVAVLFAKLVAWAQNLYFQAFESHPYLLAIATPLIFLLAAASVKLFAFEARGSGIPQVLEAIDLSMQPGPGPKIWAHRLVSVRTAFIKVISTTIGILGGASIGREGPSVQIASSAFAWIGDRARKFDPQMDFRSFVTTGAAAGVAAAFNAPLAGITFAIEEVSEGMFGPFKQLVLLGVVIAGITAQAISGDYLYFGHPQIKEVLLSRLLLDAVTIGIVAGCLGGLFAKLIVSPKALRLPENWILRALVCGSFCALLSFVTGGATAGSGYEVTKQSLEASTTAHPFLLFPAWKFVTTILSYHSGMAGGIFSPCLSIGSGIGFTVAALGNVAGTKACALIGMVAFFSGVVQAPLTAVIIVTEMTDQHTLILPFIASAFIAQGMGKLMMPVPLYRYIANQHTPPNSHFPPAGVAGAPL